MIPLTSTTVTLAAVLAFGVAVGLGCLAASLEASEKAQK